MASAAADILHQAAELNRRDERRRGNVLHMEEGVEMIVTGDLHGNRVGLSKILSHAALTPDCPRRLVLQELIHGHVDLRTGHDRSIEQLVRAARTKVACPRQVLFLLGNHDISQITGSEIMKDGHGVCRAFAEGVGFAFPNDGEEVLEAAMDFLRSQALTIRCPSGVLISHSLPSPSRMNTPWADVLDREYRPDDYRRGGGAYEWTWGRLQTDEQIEKLAEHLNVQFFVIGHKHLDADFEVIGPRAVALTSEHEHGCILKFSGDQPLTAEAIPGCIRPIVTL